MTVEPCAPAVHYLLALCIQKLYHRPQLTIGGSWNKNIQLILLQRCYCENSRSPTSACVMRRHYSNTYTQLLHLINGLLAVGRVGNLLCGRRSYTFVFYRVIPKVAQRLKEHVECYIYWVSLTELNRASYLSSPNVCYSESSIAGENRVSTAGDVKPTLASLCYLFYKCFTFSLYLFTIYYSLTCSLYLCSIYKGWGKSHGNYFFFRRY